jgi:hypothetical protein
MITPNVLKALRVVALEQADSQSFPAWYNSVCRWYSREFHTPLHMVEEMPYEQVLKVYYEDSFWKLRTGTEEQRAAFQEIIADALTQDHEETKAAAQEAEEENDSWYEQELAQINDSINKQGVKIIKENDALRNPNLEKDIHKFVEAEDDPVPDDGE